MRRDSSRVSTIFAALVAATSVVAASTQEQGKQQQPGATSGDQAAKSSQATKVDLDELEKNPEKYLGKTVTVEGEVDRVLGPHLFTIDERNWADPDRELPVVVPEPFTAIVRSDAPVRVTGTVQKVPLAQIQRYRGLLDKEDKIRAEIETQPALLATDVTATTPAAVSLRVRTDQPVGTSGTSTGAPVSDIGQVAKATDKKQVGQRVDVKNATVGSTTDDGFWVQLPTGERIFVLPAKPTSVKEGQSAAIEGVILELPEGLQVKLNAKNEPVYIYAERVVAK